MSGNVQSSTAESPSLRSAVERPKRRNMFALGGAQVITWSVTLLWTFIVPRRLGASGWGMLVIGSSIASIIGVIASYGTINYLVRELVRRPGDAAGLLGTSFRLRSTLLVPATAVLIVYLCLAKYTKAEVIIIVIAAVGVCFLLFGEPFDSVFQAVERFEFLAAGDVINTAGQSLVAIGLVMFGFGVIPVALSALAISGPVFALKWFWARRFYRPRMRTKAPTVQTMARESTPYWMMSLFVMFYVWVDTAMLSLMAPPNVVGWYGMPVRLFGTLQFAANMLSRLWLPRLIVAFENREGAFKRVARVPLEQALIVSIPIALGGAAISGSLMRFLFGDDFANAGPVMAILALCLIPLYLNIMAYAVLVASGRQMVWTKTIIAASVVNPLLNLRAIDFFQSRYGNGAIGAATSLLVTETLIASFSLLVVTRGILTRESAGRILRSLIAGLAMAGAVSTSSPLGLIPRILLGIVVYGVLALLLNVPSEHDVQTAREVIGRVLRRRRRGTHVPPVLEQIPAE